MDESCVMGKQMLLDGRVALITGAARGIGRGIALAFAANGAKVALSARSEKQLHEVEGEIREAGGEAIVLPADLTDRSTPARLVSEVERSLGEVQILVNNAALVSAYNPKPVVDFDDDYWDRSLLINLTMPYLLSKVVLPGMLRNRWGRILNIASVNAKVAALHGVAYAATKHGLLGLTRTLALEVAKEGITVNAICPGPVVTEINNMRIRYDAGRMGRSFEELESSLTPMGRRVEPEEVGALAVFLASEQARGITGQPYNIDCGQVMY